MRLSMKISQANYNNKNLNFSAFRIKDGENVDKIIAFVQRHYVQINMDGVISDAGVVWTKPDSDIVRTLKTEAEREALSFYIEQTAPAIGMQDLIDSSGNNKSRDVILNMITFTKDKLMVYLRNLAKLENETEPLRAVI